MSDQVRRTGEAISVAFVVVLVVVGIDGSVGREAPSGWVWLTGGVLLAGSLLAGTLHARTGLVSLTPVEVIHELGAPLIRSRWHHRYRRVWVACAMVYPAIGMLSSISHGSIALRDLVVGILLGASAALLHLLIAVMRVGWKGWPGGTWILPAASMTILLLLAAGVIMPVPLLPVIWGIAIMLLGAGPLVYALGRRQLSSEKLATISSHHWSFVVPTLLQRDLLGLSMGIREASDDAPREGAVPRAIYAAPPMVRRVWCSLARWPSTRLRRSAYLAALMSIATSLAVGQGSLMAGVIAVSCGLLVAVEFAEPFVLDSRPEVVGHLPARSWVYRLFLPFAAPLAPLSAVALLGAWLLGMLAGLPGGLAGVALSLSAGATLAIAIETAWEVPLLVRSGEEVLPIEYVGPMMLVRALRAPMVAAAGALPMIGLRSGADASASLLTASILLVVLAGVEAAAYITGGRDERRR